MKNERLPGQDFGNKTGGEEEKSKKWPCLGVRAAKGLSSRLEPQQSVATLSSKGTVVVHVASVLINGIPPQASFAVSTSLVWTTFCAKSGTRGRARGNLVKEWRIVIANKVRLNMT